MANLNKVMLIGNLTRDPEIKYTPKGTSIADISLAIGRVYTTPSGEKKEEVTYVDVELWERQAEIAGQYLKKGRPVFIEGRLRLDTWDDKQTGQKRSKLKVRGEFMQLLGSRADGEGGAPAGASQDESEYDQRPAAPRAAAPGGYNKPAPVKPKPAPASEPDVEEDDIPF